MDLRKNSQGSDSGYRIALDKKSIEIWLHKIDDSDFLIRSVADMWGETTQRTIKPELNGKQVLSWGRIEAPAQNGLNIVLTSAESGEYGDWYILTNTHSALTTRKDNRPDPFAFTNDELIEEIHHVNVMHVYNTTVTPFDISIIIEFISDKF